MKDLPDWVVEVRDGNRKQCTKAARLILTDGWGTLAPGEMARKIVDLTMAADEQVIMVMLQETDELGH